MARGFYAAGEVYAGYVGSPRKRGVYAAVTALKECEPRIVQEPSIVGNGGEAVLGEEEWVIAAEALTFGLDEALVVRVVLGDGLPVELEMAFYAVGALEFEVGLLDLLEEGAIVPGSTVVDGGNVGGGTHRHEVAVELVGRDVLGLVDFEKDVGGGADDVASRVGAEEELSGVGQADATAMFDEIVTGEADAVEEMLEAAYAYLGLGLEGGGGFYGGAAVGTVADEGRGLDVG